MLPFLALGGTLIKSKAAKRVGKFLASNASRLLQKSKFKPLQKLGGTVSGLIDAKKRGGAVDPATLNYIAPTAENLDISLSPYEETRDKVTKEVDKILGDATKTARTAEAGKTWYYLAAGVALVYLLKK